MARRLLQRRKILPPRRLHALRRLQDGICQEKAGRAGLLHRSGQVSESGLNIQERRKPQDRRQKKRPEH